MKKVWVYVIGKALPAGDLRSLTESGKSFVSSWTAHENQLAASFRIFENRIIIIEVDEEVVAASGCSIDKLYRFMKESEARFGVELLNRMNVAYRSDKSIEVVHTSTISKMLGENTINGDTPIFNTAVSTGKELEQWEQPLKETWLKKFLVKV